VAEQVVLGTDVRVHAGAGIVEDRHDATITATTSLLEHLSSSIVMSLNVRENRESHRYEAVDEAGAVSGFVEYVDHDDTRELVHAEVRDELEGQGVGSTLARGVLDAVLDAGVATRVTCPFLVSWVERHPEYAGQVVLG